MRTEHLKTFAQTAIRAAFALIVGTGLLVAVGCGGAGSNLSAGPTPTPGSGAGAANTQVRFGDAPADSVISFEVSVSSLSLTPSGGGQAVNVAVPANNRIEDRKSVV